MSNEPARKRSRISHAEAVLGEEQRAQLSLVKVLVVGAGGIGCELLKNVVLSGFGNITLLDLDTIDLSNLNRQFLFRKKDIKQSKAMVAARTAQQFNPSVRIKPIHANIKDAQFDVAWFRGFDIVLNALDNLDARRHVNKMCLAASVPLVESGTAGYLGQVQPIVKGRTECFDCLPKPTPKTFPVCTIRSTPSQPIHCIVWAKNYLIPQLFGETEEGEDDLDDALKAGENAQEIANLRKEAQAFSAVRRSLRAPQESSSSTNGSLPNGAGSSDPARLAFTKVFNNDIKNLLSMADMWKSREPPVPLDFDQIGDGTFSLPARGAGSGPASSSTATGKAHKNGVASSSTIPNGKSTANGTSSASGLKDQKELSLQENLVLFISSTHRLAARLRNGEETISFDKDDDDTLDFVTAASNLRSTAYGIPGKSRWEIKEMAGNIIPAIATTNAIIAGIIVLQALQLLRKTYNGMRNVHLQRKPEVPLNACMAGQPSKECGVCSDMYVSIQCDPDRATVSDVVTGLLGEGDGNGTGSRDVSVYEDKRLLYDPDFDDNEDRTLASLGVTQGKFLTIVDEDGELATLAVAITSLPPNHPHDGPALILPAPLPIPPTKPKPPQKNSPSQPSTSRKRALDGEDDVEVRPTKRPKSNGAPPVAGLPSPSKKRKLDEEGLLMLENLNDKLEDEPELITID